jgi:hypothetical protein
MKSLAVFAAFLGITLSVVAQSGARPMLLVDVSGNPYPNGSGTALPYTPPSMICYTSSAGSILPCNFAGGGGDTITSPNATLSVGGTVTATTLDLNLAHANTWTAAQAFGVLSGTFGTFTGISTTTNCANASSPAVCAAAAAGSVAVPAGTNPTLQVNTTRVTANSQILLQEDQSAGTRLAVTCQAVVDPTWVKVTARSAGASFTFQITGTFATNPVCFSYTIIN